MGSKRDSEGAHAPRQILNRKARYNYELLDTYEAGIVLIGSEVKSLFLGKANMTDAYCRMSGGELLLISLDIEPYEKAAHFQPERRRDRKLLLHRKEIDMIDRKSMEKGLSIIPTRIYFKGGKAKIEVALARGRRQYDKRDKIAADDARRESQQARNLR